MVKDAANNKEKVLQKIEEVQKFMNDKREKETTKEHHKKHHKKDNEYSSAIE